LVEQVLRIDDYDRKKCHDYAVDFFSSSKMTIEYLKKYEQVLNGGKLNEQPPKRKLLQDQKFLPFD